MKKINLFISFMFLCVIAFSQTDTLYLQKNKKISCKILEINDTEIKYKLSTNSDGPLYIMDKTYVTKYTLSGGFTERIVPDELSIEHEHDQILQNRSAIKIDPFSFAFSHIAIAYERVIKIGMNLDVEAGYINSGINPQFKSINFGSSNNSLSNSGAYFKPGIKFFLGEDYSVKGLKYAHPLKGRYIRLDLAVSYVSYKDISNTFYSYGNSYGNNTSQTVYSNLNAIAYGGFVNYGRQFILGNILTLDYFVGIGFTGQSTSYSNPNFFTNPIAGANNQYNNGYYNYNENNYIASYHGFLRVPVIGLSFTSGFRIGYIIPHKDNSKRKPGNQ